MNENIGQVIFLRCVFAAVYKLKLSIRGLGALQNRLSRMKQRLELDLIHNRSGR